jgi:hypothetical protein
MSISSYDNHIPEVLGGDVDVSLARDPVLRRIYTAVIETGISLRCTYGHIFVLRIQSLSRTSARTLLHTVWQGAYPHTRDKTDGVNVF